MATLIIDGNAMLNVMANVLVYHSRTNSSPGISYITVDDKIILKDNCKQQYKTFTLKYLSNIIYPLRFCVSDVYMVFDSVSWRKFFIEKFFQRNPELKSFVYKGHRKKDEHAKLLGTLFEFYHNEVLPDLVEKTGVRAVRAKGAEGDDAIAILNSLIEDDQIIWSIDSDMCQCVALGDKSIIMIGPHGTSKTKKMFLPLNFWNEKKRDLLDFEIETQSSLLSTARNLIAGGDYDSREIDVDEYVFKKVLMGDKASDNIPSVYVRTSDSGKNYGITSAKADAIINGVRASYGDAKWAKCIDALDDAFLRAVVIETMRVTNAPQCEISSIEKRVRLNARIIRLSMHTIPPEMIRVIARKYDECKTARAFDHKTFADYISSNLKY